MGTIIDLTTNLRKKTTEEETFLRSHFDTEIIHLQSFDNFYSLMDRLNQRDAAGQSSHRLLLVWPVRGRILEIPIEFGRLRGWAVRNQYEIALVIPDNAVKMKMAAEQGLPAFKSVREAGEKEWLTSEESSLTIGEEPERIRKLAILKKDVEQTEKPQASFGIRFLFFLLALAACFAVLYAVFPQARVEITPYLTRKSINMNIWTDERLDAPTLAGGIPLIEKRFTLNLSASVPTTGSVQAEPGLAVGEISVRNTCDRIYASSAGVRVGTDEDFANGINFITLEDATLTPGEERIIHIEAETGGIQGNLPAGSIRFAEYPKSICWVVSQARPTSGGTSGRYQAPSDNDILEVRKQIDEQIQPAAAEALKNDPESGDLIALGEVSIASVKNVQTSPDIGYASETYSMKETVVVSWQTVRKSDMEAIVRGQSSRMSMEVHDFIGYEILAGPQEENGLMTWSVRADYLVYEPQTNPEALQIMLRGKTLSQAASILNSLKHIKSTSITILPSRLKRMPLAAQNIRVIIHPATEAEEK